MRHRIEQYLRVRAATEALCAPLQIEDYGLQGMPCTSPPKWHLAHTSWFFETFVLQPFVPGYQPYQAGFEVLFNSYYNGIGAQYPRPQRGLLSRPTTPEIYRYRAAVDRAVLDLLTHLERQGGSALSSAQQALQQQIDMRVELGLHHEQQHQELLLTDLKYSFSLNPLHPVYQARPPEPPCAAGQIMEWQDLPEGRVDIGADGETFCFDNERPRHSVWLAPVSIARRPVSNAEFQAFIEDGGYRRPEWWLADGWAALQQHGWNAPLYWHPPVEPERDSRWWVYTLHGLEPLAADAPVCHVSYYEADAYARWAGARLPTEAEWEVLATGSPRDGQGQFVESGILQPGATDAPLGGVWEWTSSSYAAYPGFEPAAGAIGEYNGKFMCNQYVLRGGSCATPRDHIRPSYRNFFYPADRWQFSGIRLARDGRGN